MIFAAGLGTRLKPLTDTCPKALIEVTGKPILERLILKLKETGYDKMVVNVHHHAKQITGFLEANENFGTEIKISDETEQLLDTGGGLAKAFPLLEELSGASTCHLVHNVDILSNCDYEALRQHHLKSNSKPFATLLVSKRKTSRYLLFDQKGRLHGWINKETQETKPIGFRYEEGKYDEYAYSGIQMVDKQLGKLLPQGKYSIIDFYLSVCHEQLIQCHIQDNLRLIDIGKPETLEKAEEFLNGL